MQYQIENDRLKVSIGGYSEKQLVTRLLLKLSVWELQNSMVITQQECGMKEVKDENNNIFISDSALQTILPPKLKNLSARHRVMCGCECFV